VAIDEALTAWVALDREKMFFAGTVHVIHKGTNCNSFKIVTGKRYTIAIVNHYFEKTGCLFFTKGNISRHFLYLNDVNYFPQSPAWLATRCTTPR
jgi:hypothetical protein